MSTFARVKTWTAEILTSSDLNAEFDAIITAGNAITDDNISAGADINGNKLLANSVTSTQLSTSGLLNTQGFVNLVENGNFPSWGAGTDAVPDGWTLHLTPTIAQDTKPTGSPAGYSCKITSAGAGDEGIKQTIPCRASTTYSYALYEKVTSGDTIKVYLTDNGGTPSTDSNEYTDTSWTRKNDTITTASDATELTIYIRAKTDGDIVWAGEVCIIEGSLLKQFVANVKQQAIQGWIQFNGTGTIAINDSYNVTSITDNGTGNYTITWETDFANDDYAVAGMANDYQRVSIQSMAVGSVNIATTDSVEQLTDSSIITLMAIGDQS